MRVNELSGGHVHALVAGSQRVKLLESCKISIGFCDELSVCDSFKKIPHICFNLQPDVSTDFY